MNPQLEKSIAKFFSLGLFVTTVIVIVRHVYDPVNISKLFVLGATAFGALVVVLDSKWRSSFLNNRIELCLFSWLFLAGLVATFFSTQPIQRSIYGASGRNFGLVTLISYLIIFIVLTQFKEITNIQLIMYSFGASGLVNIIYGILATYVTDPIQWNNVYGALLGTFGNPNFAGSFYGLMSAYLLALALDSNKNRYFRLASAIFIPLNFLCIVATNTTQGLLLFGLTNSIVLGFYLKLKLKNTWLLRASVVTFALTFSIILLGILQKGPLVDFVYKRTVSLRGVYWDAALNTGLNHFWTGVGLDGLGDWYRRYRSLKAATWLPGPDTVTNSAHNQFLDLFAFGGISLLLPYILLIILGFRSIYVIYKNQREFDFLPVTLTALFVGHVAQSTISLHQIGISVWGWVLVGLLSAYSKNLKFGHVNNRKMEARKSFSKDEPWNVGIFIGTCIGVIICIPPFTAEAKLVSAIKSQDYAKIDLALQQSYFTPLNSNAFNETIILLESNNLGEQALQLTRRAIKFNPDSFDSWKLLYYISKSTSSEKEQAKLNMMRLDPLNKKLEKLK